MTDLRAIARGKPCMIRLPGCTGGGRDTVLTHYRLAGYSGTRLKPPDLMGAWGCAHCHDIADGRVQTEHDRQTVRLAHAEGVIRTVVELQKLKQAREELF